MNRNITLLIVFFLSIFSLTYAQDETSDSTETEEVIKNLPSDPPRNFSFIFGRSFLIANSSPDSVPLSSTGSGTYSVGAGWKVFLVGSKLGLRIAPSMTWQHLTYENTQAKSYPTVFDSTLQLEREKHILAYGNLAMSVFYSISTDEDGDPLYFVEAGGYGSYLLGGNYRRRFVDDNGFRRRERTQDIASVTDEWMPVQYGLMARVGYKWFAIQATYRLSDVLDEFTNNVFLPKEVTGYRNPIIPPLEIGLNIFF